jgi:hypothetical protein
MLAGYGLTSSCISGLARKIRQSKSIAKKLALSKVACYNQRAVIFPLPINPFIFHISSMTVSLPEESGK